MISSNAIIDPSARIAADVEVGPWTVIGPDVEIGAGTWVGPHVVIKGPTKIGVGNKIYQFSSIGEDSQDKKYHGETAWLHIGDRNVIREYCTLNRGTELGGGVTRIGNDNLLMAYVHIAHDCNVGDHTIFANNSLLAGHVQVGDYVRLSGFVAVHQFCALGAHSFIAHGAIVVQDVLPYVLVAGHKPKAYGINKIGLERADYTPATIDRLQQAYKIIFRKGLTTQQAVAELEVLAAGCPDVQLLIDGLQNSTRGIVR